MNEKNRLALAVVISMLVLVGWGYFNKPPVQPQTTNLPGATSPTNSNSPALDTPHFAKSEETKTSPQPLGKKINTTVGELGISTDSFSGSVDGLRVRLHPLTKNQIEEEIDFSQLLGIRELGAWDDGTGPIPGDWSNEDGAIIFRGKSSLMNVETRLTRLEDYVFQLDSKINVQNPDKFIFQRISYEHRESSGGSFFSAPPDLVGAEWFEDKSHHTFRRPKEFSEGYEGKTKSEWIGVSTKYFLASINAPTTADGIVRARLLPSNGRLSVEYGFLPRAKEINLSQKVFLGPKIVKNLRSVSPSLVESLQFGFLGMLCNPLLSGLKMFFSLLGNYGFAIIALTLLVKIILFPVAWKSMVSMKKMAEIQPLINQVREKYKGNPQQLNAETMKIMRENKANPVGGCLLALIQIPIFISLYRVLSNSIELYRAPFGLWIHDLSMRDPYFILPIAMTVLMYFQQKLTPMTTMDPAQQKIMSMMPIIFGVTMLSLPSGLALYMLVNSGLSIFQQYYLNRRFPTKKAVVVVNAK